MDLGLNGQVAVVTGAARGIGRAIAAEFVSEGARVVMIDADARVHQAASELNQDRAIAFDVDVTDFNAVKTVEATVRARVGPCDHLVHAAAIGSGRFGMPFWDLAPSDWEQTLRVNVIGTVNVAHAFAPIMAERRSGTILILGSVAAQIGSPTDPPYSASKAAVLNFAQCAARDLAPFGVRVNSLNPGMVQTKLNRAVWEAWQAKRPEGRCLSFEEWTAEKIQKLVPLNRWQAPEDLAAMAVFLASDRGKNITGQAINVDGGYVMHW